MFSLNQLSQSWFTENADGKKFVNFHCIPKKFFVCIIQYLYSDHFHLSALNSKPNDSLQNYIDLIIYADYFMLDRMVQIISKRLQKYISIQNILSILLISHTYNARDLSKLCLNYITMNCEQVNKSIEW